jgi:uncharacterized protein YceK
MTMGRRLGFVIALCFLALNAGCINAIGRFIDLGTGCSTLPFEGVRESLGALRDERPPLEKLVLGIDLPFTAALDTVCLPLDVLGGIEEAREKQRRQAANEDEDKSKASR